MVEPFSCGAALGEGVAHGGSSAAAVQSLRSSSMAGPEGLALTEAQRLVMRAISACRTLQDARSRRAAWAPVSNSARRRLSSLLPLATGRPASRCPRALGPGASQVGSCPLTTSRSPFTVPGGLLAQRRWTTAHLSLTPGSPPRSARSWRSLGQGERRLVARLGLTAVMHTWPSDLCFHLHVNCRQRRRPQLRSSAREPDQQVYHLPVPLPFQALP